jgi:hypothetical protein
MADDKAPVCDGDLFHCHSPMYQCSEFYHLEAAEARAAVGGLTAQEFFEDRSAVGRFDNGGTPKPM